MKRITTDPRPPVNQGIDNNNAIVLRHTQIYNALIAHVTENIGYVALSVNPYGTAPLSGYLGIWATNTTSIRVQISDDIGSVPVDYSYTPVLGANLVPLVGLAPDAANQILITIPGTGTASTVILTNPLPPTDAEIPPDPGSGDQIFPPHTGFPIYEVTMPATNPTATIDQLYFTAFNNRYNVGADHTGRVRWYTTLDMPAFNFIRLRNGNFLGSANNLNGNRLLYQFDMVGRVYAAYILDNECHHSVYEMPNGNILLPSGNDEGSETVEDGLSIIDLSTGLEVAYYDIRDVMDMDRTPRPGGENDWIHINQSYFNVTNNLLVTSGRHQGVFGMDADTGELAFILGNREGWGEDFQEYLLTPVDESGNPLYDFSDPEDVDRADKEFWQWGQHSTVEIPNDTQGIVEFILFDNGNFRSRSDELSVLPNDNHSRLVHYRVDLSNMTVIKLFEYGQSEVGSRGYSSYVSNGYIIDNGNYLINFGSPTMDENGRMRSDRPGFSDLVDPLMGDQAMTRIVLTEVDPSTGAALIEFTISSGRYKNAEDDGPTYFYDLFSFRSFKDSIIP